MKRFGRFAGRICVVEQYMMNDGLRFTLSPVDGSSPYPSLKQEEFTEYGKQESRDMELMLNGPRPSH